MEDDYDKGGSDGEYEFIEDPEDVGGVEDAEGQMQVDLISGDPGLEAELKQEMKRWAKTQRIDKKQKQPINWKELSDAEKMQKAAEIKKGVAQEILGKYTGQTIEWFDEELTPEFPELESKFPFLKGPSGESGIGQEEVLAGEKKKPRAIKTFPYSVQRTLVPKKAKELSFVKLDEKGKPVLDVDGNPVSLTSEEIANARRPVFTRDYFFKLYAKQYPPPGDDPVRKAIRMKETEIETLVQQIEQIKKNSEEITLPSGAAKARAEEVISLIDSRDEDYYLRLAEKEFPVSDFYTPWLPSPSDRPDRIREYADGLMAADARMRLKEEEILGRTPVTMTKKSLKWKPETGSRGLMELYRKEMARWDDLAPRVPALEQTLIALKTPRFDSEGKKRRLSPEEKAREMSIEYDLYFYRTFDYSATQIALANEQTTQYELSDLVDRTFKVLAEEDGPKKTRKLVELQAEIREKLVDVDLDLSSYDLKQIEEIRRKISILRDDIIALENGRTTTKILMDFSGDSTNLVSRVNVLKSKPRLATYRGQKVVVDTYANLGVLPGSPSSTSEWLITIQGTSGPGSEILTNSKEFSLDDLEANPYDQRLGIGSLTLIPAKFLALETTKKVRNKKMKTIKVEVKIDPAPVLAIVTDFDKTGVTALPLLSATRKMTLARIRDIQRRIDIRSRQNLKEERLEVLKQYLQELEDQYSLLRERKSRTELEELSKKRKQAQEEVAVAATEELVKPVEREEETLKKLKGLKGKLTELARAPTSVKVTYAEIEEVNGPRLFTGPTRKVVPFGDRKIGSDVVIHYIQTYFRILKKVFSGTSDDFEDPSVFQKKFEAVLVKTLPNYFSLKKTVIPERVWTVSTKGLQGDIIVEEIETGPSKKKSSKKPSTISDKARKEAKTRQILEKALEQKWIESINEHYQGAGLRVRTQVIQKLVQDQIAEDSAKLPDELLEDFIQGTMFLGSDQSLFEGADVLARDGAKALFKSISKIRGGYNVVQRFRMKLTATLGTEEPMTIEELIRTTINEEIRYIRGFPGPYGPGLSEAQRIADQTKIFMQAQYSRYLTKGDADVEKFQKKYLSDPKWTAQVIKEYHDRAKFVPKKPEEEKEPEKKTEVVLYEGDNWLIERVCRAFKSVLESKDIVTNSDLVAQMRLCYLVFESVLAPKFKYVKQALLLKTLPIESLPFGEGKVLAPELYLNDVFKDEKSSKFEGIKSNLQTLQSESFDKLERYLDTSGAGKKVYQAKPYPYNIEDSLVNLDEMCMKSTGTGMRLLSFSEIMAKALETKSLPGRDLTKTFGVTEPIPDDDLILDITDSGQFVCSSVREIVDDYYYNNKRYSSDLRGTKGKPLPTKFQELAKSLPKPSKPLQTLDRLSPKEKLDLEKAADWILVEWRQKVGALRNPVVEVAKVYDETSRRERLVKSLGNRLIACPELGKDFLANSWVEVSDISLSYTLTGDLKSPYDVIVKLISPSSASKEDPSKWKLKAGKGKYVSPILTRAPKNEVEKKEVAGLVKKLIEYFSVPEDESKRKEYYEDPSKQKLLLLTANTIPHLEPDDTQGASVLRQILHFDLGSLIFYAEQKELRSQLTNFLRSGNSQELLEEVENVFHNLYGDSVFGSTIISNLAQKFLSWSDFASVKLLDTLMIDPEVVDYYLRPATLNYFSSLILKHITGMPYIAPRTMKDIEDGVSRKEGLTEAQMKFYRLIVEKYLYPIGPSQTQQTVFKFGGYVPTLEEVDSQAQILLEKAKGILKEKNRTAYLQSVLESDAFTLKEAMRPKTGSAQWIGLFEVVMKDEDAIRLLGNKLGRSVDVNNMKELKQLNPILSAGFHDAFSKTTSKTRAKLADAKTPTNIVELVFGAEDLSLRWKSAWKWLNEGMIKMQDNDFRRELNVKLGWNKKAGPSEFDVTTLFRKKFENLPEGTQRSLLNRVGKIGHTTTTIKSFVSELVS